MNHIVFRKSKFFSHPIYDNYYSSKEGEIYSKKSNKILKLQKHTAGYLIFSIFEKKKVKVIMFIDMFLRVFMEIYQKIKKLIILMITRLIIILKICSC